MNIVLFIIIILLFILLELILRRTLKIEKKDISETEGKKVYRIGIFIITVVTICFIPIVVTKDTFYMTLFLFLFFIIRFGFELFVEWKYMRESREYLITLANMVLVIIVAIGFFLMN
ncbi:DUF4181 domain-containing protein [Ureibacillus composti]|nr:DUF4181 domain-containing protein [Ureibacillus composti]